MIIKRMFSANDGAGGAGEPPKEEIVNKEIAKEETVKDTELFKGFTPEQVLKMKEDLKLEYQEQLKKAREEASKQAIEDYKKQLIQEQEIKERQAIFDKIEGDSKLKEQFQNFGVDYKSIDKDNLSIYMKIFESKGAEETASPKGEKVIEPNSNVDFDKIIAEEFTKAGV